MMQMKLAVSGGFLAVLALTCAVPQAKGADEAAVRGALYGQWRDPKTDDSYRFNGNQTYVFRAGPQKSRSGNLRHSGTWSLYEPNSYSNFPPYGLQLHATQRQVLRRGKIVTRPAHRVFDLLFQPAYLQVPRGVTVYLSKNGRYYYRKPNNPQIVHWLSSSGAQNPERLFIGPISFVRVR